MKCRFCHTFLSELLPTDHLEYSHDNHDSRLEKINSNVDVRILYALTALTVILVMLLAFGIKFQRDELNKFRAVDNQSTLEGDATYSQAKPFYLTMVVRDDDIALEEALKGDTDNNEGPVIIQQMAETATEKVAPQSQPKGKNTLINLISDDIPKGTPQGLAEEIDDHKEWYENDEEDYFRWGYDDGYEWARNHGNYERLIKSTYVGTLEERYQAEIARGLSTEGEHWLVGRSLGQYRGGWEVGVRGFVITLLVQEALEDLED